jgi:hypothetical protein
MWTGGGRERTGSFEARKSEADLQATLNASP